jgi:hypothetical protein
MKKNSLHPVNLVAAILLIAAALSGCTSSQGKQMGKASFSSLPEIDGYTNWLRITPENYQVSPEMALLCNPIPGIIEGTAGEHAKVPLAVYVNVPAVSQLTNNVRSEFPTGSIIVKAKYGAGIDAPSELGVMMKRFAGYDPEGGNWEYAFVRLKGVPPVERGLLANCRDCHSARKRQDFVFAKGVRYFSH